MNTRARITFLIEIIRPYKHVALLVILLSILASGFDGVSIGLLVPLLVNLQDQAGIEDLPKAFRPLAELLNHYPVNQQILLAMGFVLLAILLKNIFIAVSAYVGFWLSTRLRADLRMRAMKLLMTVGIDYHYKLQSGDHIYRSLNNTSMVESFIRITIEFIVNALTLAVLCGVLLLLSWQLTLLAMILGLVMLLLMSYYSRALGLLSVEAAKTGRELLSAVAESLGGIQLIKSYNKERQHIALLSERIEANRQTAYRLSFKLFSVHPLADVLGSVAIAVLFITAMILSNMNTQLILVQLLPFMYVLLRIVPLLKSLQAQRAEMISCWPFIDLVFNLLREDDKPIVRDGHQLFKGLQDEIRFQAVTFSYDAAETPVLHEVEFSLPANKTTAIVGESGAGKSTITNLLLRFYDPQQGRIFIDGEPLPNFRLETYHRRISIVSQDTFLFNNTVKYNIAYGADSTPSEERIIEAAKKAGAHKFIMALPKGYGTFVGDRGVRLSGGQRQRLAIARAVIREPEILILDEATSSLDMRTERQIHGTIVKLSQGRTVIIIAHRLSTIKNADQIIVLKDGKVAEVGNAGELLNRKGEYYTLTAAGARD